MDERGENGDDRSRGTVVENDHSGQGKQHSGPGPVVAELQRELVVFSRRSVQSEPNQSGDKDAEQLRNVVRRRRIVTRHDEGGRTAAIG